MNVWQKGALVAVFAASAGGMLAGCGLNDQKKESALDEKLKKEGFTEYRVTNEHGMRSIELTGKKGGDTTTYKVTVDKWGMQLEGKTLDQAVTVEKKFTP